MALFCVLSVAFWFLFMFLVICNMSHARFLVLVLVLGWGCISPVGGWVVGVGGVHVCGAVAVAVVLV